MKTYEKIETLYQRDIEGTKKLMPGVYRNPITAWFNRHPGDYSYVILDDDDDMDGHMDHLVRTDFDSGLTEEKADECIRRLRGQ